MKRLWIVPGDFTPVQMMPTGAMSGTRQESPPEQQQDEKGGGVLGRCQKLGKKKA